jgi:hypothetical protein
MSSNSKTRSSVSYSGRQPDLASGTPVSLRNVKPAVLFFNEAVDPLLKKQREALLKTEAQRREESGAGSNMVKLHKPFPELKPKYELKPVRDTFNQNLLKEHREAALKHLKAQEQNNNKVEQAPAPTHEPSM